MPKNMRLSQNLIDRARKILVTRTETETVEQAFELVAFRDEVVEGISAMAGSNAVQNSFQCSPE